MEDYNMKRILILLLTVTTVAQVSAECSTNRCHRRHRDRQYGPVTTVVSPITEPLHIYPVTDVATRPADVLLGDGWLYDRDAN